IVSVQPQKFRPYDVRRARGLENSVGLASNVPPLSTAFLHGGIELIAKPPASPLTWRPPEALARQLRPTSDLRPPGLGAHRRFGHPQLRARSGQAVPQEARSL